MSKQRALVSLDLVLDTRYGTLCRIDQGVADALVETPQYRYRHLDNFGELTKGAIDQQRYDDLYAKRDVYTLAKARFTDFLYELRQEFIEGTAQLDRGAIVDELTVDINLWPYRLTRHEQKIILRSIVHYIPRSSVHVAVVYIAPEDLSPKDVDACYELMAWYSEDDWLIPNSHRLIKQPLPTNTLLTPKISSSGILPPQDQEIKDPFLAKSAVLLKFISLVYMGSEKVCFNPAIVRLVESHRQQASPHSDDPHPQPDPPQEAPV